MRPCAPKLGYAQVAWYRGGLDSWKAASLPLVPTVVRAVVNRGLIRVLRLAKSPRPTGNARRRRR